MTPTEIYLQETTIRRVQSDYQRNCSSSLFRLRKSVAVISLKRMSLIHFRIEKRNQLISWKHGPYTVQIFYLTFMYIDNAGKGHCNLCHVT